MDRVKRGDLVVVAVPGDNGKPRPAVVVQADVFNETHVSVTLVSVTSTFGHLEDDTLLRVSRALALWVGIAA